MTNIIEEYKGRIPNAILEDYEKESKNFKITKAQEKEILDRIEKDYNNALISPGEAIGVITAESFGEPGTQMSIWAYEKLILKINNKIKILPAGNFIDGLMKLKGSLKLNKESEISPLNDLDIYVPSLNQEEKVEWKKVIECSRHKTNKKLIKLVTASGRRITCTDNHSFVTRSNNKIVPIKGSDLKIGDRIPTLNNFDSKDILKEIEVYDYNCSEFIDENGMIHGKHGAANIIKNYIPLNGLTGWFIGAYLAEGYANKYGVMISNINDDYI